MLSNGILSTQEDSFYDNAQNYSMVTLNEFGNIDDSTDFMMELLIKNEFEWAYDFLSISLSCDTCQDDILEVVSDHNWNWSSLFIPFSIYDNLSRKINLNFYSDGSLNYRGARIDDLIISYKPNDECVVGDIVLDGIINVIDIIGVVNIILDEEFSSFQACVSDLNIDGTIDVSDVVQIIDIITGE